MPMKILSLYILFGRGRKISHPIIELRTFGEFTIKSPTNQMAGFLTNEMTESSVHQQCPSTNHKPGKRTNLKTGYKKKQHFQKSQNAIDDSVTIYIVGPRT
jgi:hypothetical protein